MKTLLADDHPLMREGMRQVLSQLDPPVEIVDAHDYPSLFAQTAQHADLDLAVVDLNMPGFVGMRGIAQFRSRFPDIPLVVLSASESPHDVRSALEAGALGFIPKSAPAPEMLAALRRVLAGDLYVPAGLGGDPAPPAAEPANLDALRNLGFTTRQIDVARLLAQGHTNKTIGMVLSMSESTVKVHNTDIFKLLGVSNRTEAVLEIQRLLKQA
ncbi:MAG: response regulator transcription factor [Pseudomonadota bacterium]